MEKDLNKKRRPIALRYRNMVVNKAKTSDPVKYYAPRRYILNKDRETYVTNIRLKTEENLLSLVKDRKLYHKCLRNQEIFLQKKQKETMAEIC